MVSVPTRFKLIGVEVVGVGVFLLLVFGLSMSGNSLNQGMLSVVSDFPVMGVVLILLGAQIFSLIKHLPASITSRTDEVSRPKQPDPEATEGRLISVRKLVALDMSLHGPRFILLEFGIGTPGLMAFGLFVFKTFWPLGAYIFLLGINYVPLLIYAFVLRRRYGEVVKRNRDDTKYIRRYGIQQSLLLIPFAIPVLALAQWRAGHF